MLEVGEIYKVANGKEIHNLNIGDSVKVLERLTHRLWKVQSVSEGFDQVVEEADLKKDSADDGIPFIDCT